jgi:hypothetical protein
MRTQKLAPRFLQIEAENKQLENRITGMEGVTRFTIRVQIDQLLKAEQLRKAVVATLKTRVRSKPDDVYVLLDIGKVRELETFVKMLVPFTSTAKRVRTKMEQYIKQTKGAKR